MPCQGKKPPHGCPMKSGSTTKKGKTGKTGGCKHR